MFGRKKVYYKLTAIERGRQEGLRAAITVAQQLMTNELKTIIAKHNVPDGAVWDAEAMEFVKASKAGTPTGTL